MRFFKVHLIAATVSWLYASHAHANGFGNDCWCIECGCVRSLGPTSTRTSAELDGVVNELGTAGQEVVSDAKYLLTSPLRIDRKSALIVGGVAATIGGLMAGDRSIQRAFQENRTTATNDLARTLETIGFARTVLGANVALIGAVWLFREHEAGNRLMRTALVSLESQLFVEGIVGVTKFGVGRARPTAEEGVHSFSPFDGFDTSFPSSHAARSFAVAAVFAESYPQPVPFLAYTTATLIALSRIQLNEHFASDVLAGAALGFFVGKALSWRHKNPDFLHGMNIVPFVPTASSGLGLTVQGRF